MIIVFTLVMLGHCCANRLKSGVSLTLDKPILHTACEVFRGR